MKLHPLLKLIIALIIPLAVGGIAGAFTAEAIPGWYQSLNKPSFNPPNQVFAPVWTTLYILMGVSMWMVWQLPENSARNRALWMYWIQLLLNFGWSFLFFYFKTIELALIEILVLWLSIGTMLRLFYRVKPVAAYLNIPYLLWVSFATALNLAYSILN